MGDVIVVTSGKGGVGKTTTTANLGVGLAMLGKKVALVDADIGLRNLDLALGLENRIVYDLIDVAEGFCRVKQALIKDKRFEGLQLLPASQTKDKSAISPDQMRKICAELRRDFDMVLIDSPAGIEQGFRNAMAAAQQAVVVTTPEIAAVRDADRVIGLLEAAGFKHPYLVVNRARPAMIRRGEMMDIDDMVDILAVDLLGVVPEDEAAITAGNRGDPIIASRTSRTAEAFRNMARRLCGESVPMVSLETGTGFVGAVRRFIGGR